MNQGLVISAKGMLAQQRRHEVTAQNLANVSTAGYQRQTLAFHASVIQQVQEPIAGVDTKRTPFAHPIYPTDIAVATDQAIQSDIRETGNPTHLALYGEGFFVVETPQGPACTRNGAFTLAPDGRLTTGEGLPVLGEKGPINITASKWEVASDGRVLADGRVIDRLRIVTIPDLSQASRLGANLWLAVETLPAKQVQVRQGALEGSNVSAITEMLALIQATRQFEACQKCLQAIDTVLDRAVNDVGRV